LTLLTDSAPGGKNSGAIHYDQNRTLTVAERKRLQGVPDAYHICGSVEDVSQAPGLVLASMLTNSEGSPGRQHDQRRLVEGFTWPYTP
jgi:hypothetical protein